MGAGGAFRYGSLAYEVRTFAESLKGQPRSAEVNARLDEAIEAIAEHADAIQDPAQATLYQATIALLAASKATMQAIGECQRDEPYADVYVVIRADGPYYCCNHATQHCVPA